MAANTTTTAPALTAVSLTYAVLNTTQRFATVAELERLGRDTDRLYPYLGWSNGEFGMYVDADTELVEVDETFMLLPASRDYGLLDDFDNYFSTCQHVYDSAGVHIGDVYRAAAAGSAFHAEFISEIDGDSYLASSDCRTLEQAIHQILGARCSERRFGR